MKSLIEYLNESNQINEAWKDEWYDILDYLVTDIDDPEMLQSGLDDIDKFIDWCIGQLEDTDDKEANNFRKALERKDKQVIDKLKEAIQQSLEDLE